MTEHFEGAVCSRTTPESHHVRYERGDDEPISVATAVAITSFRGEGPTDGDTQLYDYVDPEALDALFAKRENGIDRCAGRVSFELSDATVTVESDVVTVTPKPASATGPGYR